MKRVAQVVLGLVLGLLIAEGAFRLRDDGAFPHVNFYAADAELGVRLEPNATERLAVGKNPVTTAHTNSLGFRGGEWGAPSDDDVIVVGDSQVFGLGVEDDQTFSARLGALNAGVPTYGPREYLATAAEILKARGKAKHVVFVLNASNDFFELDRPNRERHVVWDGWAVRKETAPASVSSFPLRQFFMRRSHLVYAARRLLAEATPVDANLRSEGTWKDLFDQSAVAVDANRDLSRERDEATARLDRASKDLGNLRPPEDPARYDHSLRGTGELRGINLEQAANGHPGDIVSNSLFEASRRIPLTAELIQLAATQLEAAKKARETERGEALKQFEIDKKEYERDGQKYRRQVQDALWALPPAQPPLPATLAAFRDLLVGFQRDHHVEVTLLLLPLDLQVDEREWAKYGETPRSMAASLLWNERLVDAVAAAGLRAFHPASALAAGEPGVFLDGDLHLTAKGHEIVARELKAVLAAPAPKATLPLVTRPPPSPAQWDEVAENTVVGSTARNCETKERDGWFRVVCHPKFRPPGNAFDDLFGPVPLLSPDSVELTSGPAEDAWLTSPGLASQALMLPSPVGTEGHFAARFVFRTQGHLEAWELHSSPRLEFVKLDGKPEQTPPADEATRRYAECSQRLFNADDQAYGETSRACYEQFGERCAELLACAEGNPNFRPPCANGWSASGRCR